MRADEASQGRRPLFYIHPDSPDLSSSALPQPQTDPGTRASLTGTMASVWHVAAGLSGASAVAAGAYGAHGFKPQKDSYKVVFETGNRYHLVHSALLGIAPVAKRPHVVGTLASLGILAFSGSCYVAALTENREMGKLAPVGGFALIGAWLALAI